MKHRILVVDDEKNTREGLKWSLEGPDKEVEVAANGQDALQIIHTHPIDLVITDLKMPGMGGLELLQQVRKEDPSIEFIVITAHGSIETAVEAMRLGAADYQIKPVDLEALKLLSERALKTRRVMLENEALRTLVDKRYGFHNIIGQTPVMDKVFQMIRQVAPTRATVLIQGESGVGKELVAHAIHLCSPRASNAFVAVNCGALSSTLLESELFGYEKGAFTHALRTKPGRFEMADGGTIFLDEITETNAEFQVKLLRVLQNQTFERVGGVETLKVDIRVIAATNRDLKQLVKEGHFREDLYYRLNVVEVSIPPLRERREDIPLLADVFLKELGKVNSREGLHFSPKVISLFQNYPWPGNVRQLRNMIERLVVMSHGQEISPADLPDEFHEGNAPGGYVTLKIGCTLAEAERELIRATLIEHQGNRAQAARALGIGRKTLYRKLEEHGLS